MAAFLGALERLTMRFRVPGVVIVVFATALAPAQRISLSSPQIAHLYHLVQTDLAARQCFRAVTAKADAALADMPHPIARIDSSERLQGDPVKEKTRQSQFDMPKIDALALTYAVTGDSKYGQKLRQFVMAWARANVATGDPVNGHTYERLIFAYDLHRSLFSPREQRIVDTWLRGIAQAQRASAKVDDFPDNKQSMRIEMVAMIGFALNDPELITYALHAFGRQLSENLLTDGSSFDFYIRDALYYHMYDLKALLRFARIADMNGVALYKVQGARGGSVAKSSAFLLAFVRGQRTHQEFLHSTVPFDRRRGENGEAKFARGHWFEPTTALATLELISYFQPAVDGDLSRLSPTKNRFIDAQSLWIMAQRVK